MLDGENDVWLLVLLASEWEDDGGAARPSKEAAPVLINEGLGRRLQSAIAWKRI